MREPGGRQLYAAAFLMEIAYGLFLVAAALRTAQAIRSPMLLGLLSPVHLLTRILGNLYFGGLTDRLGRKHPVLVSCLIMAGAYLCLTRPGTAAVILAYFICGLANSIFWPALESWIGQEGRGGTLLRQLGLFGLSFTAGLAVGSLAGGYFQRLVPAAALVLAGLDLTAVALLALRAPDPPRGAAAVRAEGDAQAFPGAATARAYLAAGRIANFATWMTIGIIRFLFPRLVLALGLPGPLVGALNCFFCLCWSAAFLTLTRFRSWIYRCAPLLMLQAVGATAALLLWLAPGMGVFFLAFGLFGLSAGMTYFASMFYSQNGAADKGRRSGLHEMILSLGTLAGPLLGGAVAEFTELSWAFLVASLAIVLAMAMEVRILSRKARTHGDTSAAVAQ